jgi:2-dehydro-3-deoxyphosphogluconate aldolase / (4S)-4-hydroxy-2-oxoglutarate aldolase
MANMMHKNLEIETLLKNTSIIPVMVIKEIEDVIPMAERMVAQGFKVLEITLRTPCALKAIRKIVDQMPEIIVGAGTIITPDEFTAAEDAGSKFIISPGHTEALLNIADEASVPFVPGAVTPSEIMELATRNYKYLKLFPAEAVGGIKFLKSIYGPLPQIKFCPTGGIDAKLAGDYLALPNVICVGGSWMV